MKRAAIYFEDNLHTTLKIKAAGASTSVSALVNEVVREAFREDAEDLKVFEKRKNEESIDFESFIRQLKIEQ